MTVATELAKLNQRVEYFICIEGIGFPASESDLSAGFNGHVFTTADLDGDLATQLGCTVHHGLQLPDSIEERFDPSSLTYEVAGLNFKIIDLDDWLEDNFTPHKEGNEAALNAALNYNDVDVQLVDGTDFVEGDVAWIAAREAVLLGVKGAGPPHTYTGSTRGYLGTGRGKADNEATGESEFAWPADSSVYSLNRFWHDRRVLLYIHVPGEAPENCIRLYSGKLRSAVVENAAGEWSFSSVGESTNSFSRMISPPVGWHVVSDTMMLTDQVVWPGGLPVLAGALSSANRRLITMSAEFLSPTDKYALAAHYQYRTEPGGVAGMRTNAWGTTPQARTEGSDAYVMERYIQIGDYVVRAVKKAIGYSAITVLTEVTAQQFGQWNLQPFGEGTAVRFPLDNITDVSIFSRFTVNGVVSRNVVDVLLMFLSSGPNEYFLADATGGTITTPTFAAASVGAVNMWAGAALFSVEGNNKDEARVILSNTANDITVERGFTNAPAATEYQIRNSIYDVLPLGWGMNVHYSKIDISSFESVRDNFLPDAVVGRFIISGKDKVDLWELVRKNICEPYGILLYISRQTGKLTARYIGDAYGDGLVDDYETIAEADVLNIGDISYQLANPLGAINLKTRPVDLVPISATVLSGGSSAQSVFQPGWVAMPGVDSDPTTHRITSDEIGLSFPKEGLAEIEVSAMLNSSDDIPDLYGYMLGRLKRYSTPPPTVPLLVDISKALDIQAGVYVNLPNLTFPVAPYTGGKGWSNQVGRVISSKIVLSKTDPGLLITCELLAVIAAAKIAPAAEIDTGAPGGGKGNDGTFDYFEVLDTEFVADIDNDKDWYYFAAGDLIELRDFTGLLKEAETINSFGDNHAANPEDANSSHINVDGVIASAMVAGDYLTFQPWSAGNTTRMDDYSAYADANGDLTGGDTAKEYG